MLAEWAVTSQIPCTALKSLLKILRKFHPNLPKDDRTLIPSSTVQEIKTISGGSYCHLGLASGLHSELDVNSQLRCADTLALQSNVDGIPLFKSSSGQMWPILCLILGMGSLSKPFVVGVFFGNQKPINPDEYLADFIAEVGDLLENGLHHNGRKHHIAISAFVCDAPARSFLKRVKQHNGYNSCEKCIQPGVYCNDERRMCFPQTDSPLRTDISFKAMAEVH